VSRRVVPDHEPIWRALADPTRREILDALRAGPETTGRLAARFPTTRFTVMEHLGVLVDAGLITVERRGRERLNHLNPVPLEQAYERWVRPPASNAAAVALRLADHVEDPMEYGIDVRAEHLVRATVERTWSSLLDLTAWWPPCWPEGTRLAFEPRLGGRLGTTDGDLDTSGRLWGVVSELRPGGALAVDGSMGLPGPVQGHWRMELTPDGSATRVVVSHRVLGEVAEDDRAGFTSRWPLTLAALAARAES
jgi:DNA-binding transcriptional ArsR family regulator